MFIRQAKLSDLDNIYELVSLYARKGKLLRRSRADIRRNIKEFFVAVKEGVIVGCICLDIYSKKMAELRSLAVKPKEAHKGAGTQLVKHCVAIAKKKKILELMAITSEERFFKTVGFDYTLPGERKALFINP